MSAIEERKAQYEKSALKQLMEANGHEICERCYCCDAVMESSPCPECGGCEQDDDEDGYCHTCQSEGKIFYKMCLGRCDENGNHKTEKSL